jgi:quercetin dioxygenase-like cupin family protein
MSSPAAASKATFYTWNDVPSELVKPDLSRRLISGERVMLAQVELQRGCIVPQHAHVHEQVTYVLSGCLRLAVGEDASASYDLRAGDVIHLPSNIPHAAQALEDSQVLDVFSPPREDWLNGTDGYLRADAGTPAPR